MSDVWRPGPYETDNGRLVVLIDCEIDGQGDVTALVSADEYSYYRATGLTASDVWPDWWPFQDATIPERELQVGDFVRYGRPPFSGTAEVISFRFGKAQMIDHRGEVFNSSPALDALYRRVKRPDDWPTE